MKVPENHLKEALNQLSKAQRIDNDCTLTLGQDVRIDLVKEIIESVVKDLYC